MRLNVRPWFFLGLALGALPLLAADAVDHARQRGAYGSLPLIFEPNQGQADPQVLFLSRNKGFQLFLTADQAVLAIPGRHKHPTPDKFRHAKPGSAGSAGPLPGPVTAEPPETPDKALRFRWVGAAAVTASGLQALPGHSNYFRGKDPHGWVTDVKQYGQVLLRQVYPGIDLTYYDHGGRELELDWGVNPGADPSQVALAVSGMQALALDAQGDAVLDLGDGQSFRLKAPVAYQDGPQGRVPVGAAYRLGGPGRLGLSLGAYDRSKPLVVDPVLAYSTYDGGTGWDAGQGITVDAAGDAYGTGQSESSSLPPAGGGMGFHGWQDAFVCKLDPNGALIYASFLGGDLGDGSSGNAIAVDAAGNAYVAGATTASDFPMVNAYQSTCTPCGLFGGASNAFLSKLDPAGNALVYSTFLGGSGFEWGPFFEGDSARCVAVDASGSAYIAGIALSVDFPTHNALQSSCLGCVSATADTDPETYNGFIAKFLPAGNALAYSTFLGLSGAAQVDGLAVDAAGCAYAGGVGWVPLAHAIYDNSTGGGFVSKLNAAGSALVYSTQFPATPYAVAVDGAGSVYFTGRAEAGLPLVNAFENGPTFWGAFAAKLDPAGTTLVYSTYLGGVFTLGFGNTGYGIAVDAAGDACIVGSTSSPSLPLVQAVQTQCLGCTSCPACDSSWQGDAFISELSPAGNTQKFSSYLGGSGEIQTGTGYSVIRSDQANAVALDASGDIYLTGYTYSTDFPTVNAFQDAYGGPTDAFISKISSLPAIPTPTPTATLTCTVAGTVTVSPTITATYTTTPSFTVSPTAAPNGDAFSLLGVFPNPFGSDGTNIGLELGYQADVALTVYTVRGEALYTGTWAAQAPGKLQLFWNGKNSNGMPLGAGAYYLTVVGTGAGRRHQAGQWVSVWR